MIFRLVMIALLGFSMTLPLADDTYRCTVTTELRVGSEFKTIRDNLSCLGDRLDRLEEIANKEEVANRNALRPELESIHRDVLDISRQTNEIETILLLGKKSPSRYIVIPSEQENGGKINPCSSDKKDKNENMMCPPDYLHTFFNTFCNDIDNCVQHFGTWEEHMPPEWKKFIEQDNGGYKFDPEGLGSIEENTNFFDYSEGQRRFDMEQFFNTVPPSKIFKP